MRRGTVDAALFVVLDGPGYVAKLIGSRDMERNAVRSKHMENGQVKMVDIAASTRARLAGSLGPEGPTGPAGPRGAPGPKADKEDRGPRGVDSVCVLRRAAHDRREAGISGGGSASNLTPLDSVRTHIKGEVQVARSRSSSPTPRPHSGPMPSAAAAQRPAATPSPPTSSSSPQSR